MGPTFFVYLPAPLYAEDTDLIHVWLTKHAHISQRQGNEWRFNFDIEVTQGRPHGCSLNVVPFGAEAIGGGKATDIYLQEDERLAYEKALGYCPTASLQFDSFSRGDKEVHKLLSQFAALLARRYNGVVDLRNAFGNYGEEYEQLEPDIVKTGKYYVVRSPPLDYEQYLADADFMDEWIQHPDFRLRD